MVASIKHFQVQDLLKRKINSKRLKQQMTMTIFVSGDGEKLVHQSLCGEVNTLKIFAKEMGHNNFTSILFQTQNP